MGFQDFDHIRMKNIHTFLDDDLLRTNTLKYYSNKAANSQKKTSFYRIERKICVCAQMFVE